MNRTDKLHGIAAVFGTPDSIIHAADTVSGSGYTQFDVHTPYPVHGMDKAMRLRPSRLGLITLVFGLSGAAIALGFMYYLMTQVYPMIIGGKPFFALPAFIPVTFEVTVLLATLSTVIGMITVFFKFPSNSHPLHETDYMKAVSGDKFGVFIEAADPKFQAENVKALFSKLGAVSVEEIYEVDKGDYPLIDLRFFALLVLVALAVGGGTYVTLNKLMFMTPFDWMSEQPRLDPQSTSTFFADGFAMRPPVKGTVARGKMPYPYMGKDSAEVELVNPLLASEEVLKLGKAKYQTFCSPCHGDLGDGKDRLRGQFVAVPSVIKQNNIEWSDGYFYHIITNGRNNMASYASQLKPDERWAVVHYVRVLQKAHAASEEDVNFVKESLNGK